MALIYEDPPIHDDLNEMGVDVTLGHIYDVLVAILKEQKKQTEYIVGIYCNTGDDT